MERQEVSIEKHTKILNEQTPADREQAEAFISARGYLLTSLHQLQQAKDDTERSQAMNAIQLQLKEAPPTMRPELDKTIDQQTLSKEIKDQLKGIQTSSEKIDKKTETELANQAEEHKSVMLHVLNGKSSNPRQEGAVATSGAPANEQTSVDAEVSTEDAPPVTKPTAEVKAESNDGIPTWIKETGNFFTNVGNNIANTFTGQNQGVPSNLAGSPPAALATDTEAPAEATTTPPAAPETVAETPLNIDGMMTSIKSKLQSSIPNALGTQAVIDSLNGHTAIQNLVMGNEKGVMENTIQYITTETAKSAKALGNVGSAEIEKHIKNSVMSFLSSLNFGQVPLDPVKAAARKVPYIGKEFHSALQKYWEDNKDAVVAQSRVDATPVTANDTAAENTPPIVGDANASPTA